MTQQVELFKSRPYLLELSPVPCSGLPWWGSLVVSTAVFRLVLTLPAHITQQKVSAKRFLMSQEMKNEVLPAIQKMTNR